MTNLDIILESRGITLPTKVHTVRVMVFPGSHGWMSELDHKELRGERGGLFHDKFCVIDNVHTICGSYNWTLNAENKNDEDAAFHFEDYKLASTYTRRFNEIWKRCEIIDV